MKISIKLFFLFVLDFKTLRCYYSEFVLCFIFAMVLHNLFSKVAIATWRKEILIVWDSAEEKMDKCSRDWDYFAGSYWHFIERNKALVLDFSSLELLIQLNIFYVSKLDWRFKD